jgi:hypothetical protein
MKKKKMNKNGEQSTHGRCARHDQRYVFEPHGGTHGDEHLVVPEIGARASTHAVGLLSQRLGGNLERWQGRPKK